jgi:putative spermidine/putrescine transport system ATP-binding protein
MDRPAHNAPIAREVSPAAVNQRGSYMAANTPVLLPTLTLTNVGLASAQPGRLQGISLEIPGGAFCTLLGPAGAGKSALLAILAGTAPAAGRATLDARDMLRDPPHRRGLGIVQQADALFPNLTLAQNVAYPLHLRHMPKREVARLVDAALDTVQLHHADRRPHEASPAERQRVAWARATIFNPRMLLLDEPLSDQPQAERAAMVATLRRLHGLLGTTTIMATRVAADALALSDQVAVLHAGRLEQVADPASLYDQPVSAMAASATGEANLLPGTVNAIDEDGIARVTLACGPIVEAQAAPSLRVRDHCLFFLRPERIAIAPMAAKDMGENALDATLLEALHLGEGVRLRLLLGSGAELLVKRPAAAGLRGTRPGQSVAVAWQEGHAMVFPKSKGLLSR